jgi:hypothetical protein
MAKVRIQYKVDDQEIEKANNELRESQKEIEKVKEGFKDTNQEVGKSKSSLVDLKGAVAGVGLGAMAIGALKEFVKLNNEIAKSRKEVALLTKATGLALDNITAKIRASARVFDKDFNEILRTANTVSQEFGISMTAAIDEINEGFTRGLDVNGEYLDTLREYSTFIKEAGLNTRQFNVLIQQQAQQGIFSDKGIDAIKEAVISIREMAPATKEAIDAIGIDTDKMIADIQSGTTTYFEAVQEIATKTKEIADPQKTGAIIADVFRGAGEDAGNFIFTLDQVGDEFGELTDEQQAYIDSQAELIAATERTERALVDLTSSTEQLGIKAKTFWENVKAGTLETLGDLVNLFTSGEEQTENFARAVAGADRESLQSAINSLNADLEETTEKLEAHAERFGTNNTEARAMAAGIRALNEKLEIAKTRMDELGAEEIAEAEAAKLAEENAIKLAKAKERQAAAAKKAAEAAEIERLQKDLERIDPTQDTQSEFIQEVTAKAEMNDIIKRQEEKLAEDLIKINQDANEQKTIDNETWLQANEEQLQTALSTFSQITSQFLDLRIQQIDQEIQANEFARNRELELAEGNAFRQIEINERIDQANDKLREEQKRKKKAAALIDIGINTAAAIIKGIAEFGPPPSPLGIAAIANAAILGLAQSAAVAAFKDGVIDLQGPGTGTSDSIPARLSKGESVMTAIETHDFKPTLQAIRNNEIAPEILNNIVMHKDVTPNIVVNDYDKLAQAIMNQPKKDVFIDENGFTGFMTDKSQRVIKRQAKFRM